MIPLRPFLLATALFTAFVAAVPSVPRETSEDLEDLAWDLGSSLGLDFDSLARLEGPTSEVVARVAEISEASVGEFDLFTATVEGRDEPSFHIARLPFDATGEGSALLVAVTTGGVIAAITVVDEDLIAVEEWAYFFASSMRRPAPRLADARAPSRIAMIEHDVAAEPVARGLIRLMREMQTQAGIYNLPSLRKREPTPEELEKVRDAYASIAELGEALEPVLGEQRGAFQDLALDSARIADEMIGMLRGGNHEGLREVRARLTRNCKSCHGLAIGDGDLKDASSERRAKLDLGDGDFVVGFDVRLRHDDLDLAQRVATRARQGLLLLSH